MARLPQPGGDAGSWGDILNDYLSQTLNSDGSLKDGVVTADKLASGAVSTDTISNGTISEVKLDSALQGKVNAVSSGSNVGMGGDITGTAANAQIANDVITDAHISSSAAIAQSKIADLTSDLASKVDTTDPRLSDDRTPDNGSVVTAKLADNAVTEPKLAAVNAPTNGYVLSWNGTGLAWAAGGSGGGDPSMGGDLTGTASNAQIAVNAVGSNELNASAVTTAKIADANVTTAKLANNAVTQAKINAGTPTNGQVLSYNGTALAWVNPSTTSTALDDLSDVASSSATNGQSLVYQSGNWIPATVTSGGGVTDHGALTGLADDDHPQYHNNARGDARYYTQAQLDTSLAGKADSNDSRLSDTRTPTDGTVTAAKLVDNAVTEPKLSITNTPANGQVLSWNGSAMAWTTNSASDPTLGGDLSGTASNAQIAAGVIVNTDISTTAAIAQSKVANLTTDLAAKASTSTTVTGATSLTGGGSLAANRTLSLVGDSATPGNSMYYGTNSSGTKGFYAVPSGGGGAGRSVVSRSAATTASAGEYVLANGATSGFTVTLPASQTNGAFISVKKTDSTVNAILVVASGGQIEGNASIVLNQQWESMDFITDGTAWYRV